MAFPARHTPEAPAFDEDGFRAELARMEARYAELWWQSPTDVPRLGPVRGRRRQRATELQIDRFADRMEAAFAAFPRQPAARGAWRARFREEIRTFAEHALGVPAAHRELILSEASFDATAAFTRGARAFERHLAIEDISQALRNFWIANLCQRFLDLEVASTPGVFAYSMLYPYTDNVLDDPRRSAAAKASFNQRLGRRLDGQEVVPADAHERQVFRLVALVESELDRRSFPEVHASLRAIHRAQTRSLAQQGSPSPYEADVLGLTLAKGGSSVLVDGYLAAGRLSPSEADFFFGYGVFLQLIDDLQDVERDLAAGHMTIFSETARAWPLDRITCRLVHFLEAVLAATERFADPRYDVLMDLVRANSVQIVVQAVARCRKRYTARFWRRLEPFALTRFAYVRKNRSAIWHRYRAANRRLTCEMGIDSIFGALADDSADVPYRGPGIGEGGIGEGEDGDPWTDSRDLRPEARPRSRPRRGLLARWSGAGVARA